MAKNARFWVWHGEGYVKLTLKPGQSLSVSRGGPTDEGYYYRSTTWTHEGETVERADYSEASDCDGRLDSHCTCVCPIEKLREPSDISVPLPEWERVNAGQRDYAAEAAGY
jgi:hypothetical protein